jgi:hypothetical protein
LKSLSGLLSFVEVPMTSSLRTGSFVGNGWRRKICDLAKV